MMRIPMVSIREPWMHQYIFQWLLNACDTFSPHLILFIEVTTESSSLLDRGRDLCNWFARGSWMLMLALMVLHYQAFGLYAGGFAMRPIGSLVFGAIGDKWGSARALQISILAMALPTTLIGMMNSIPVSISTSIHPDTTHPLLCRCTPHICHDWHLGTTAADHLAPTTRDCRYVGYGIWLVASLTNRETNAGCGLRLSDAALVDIRQVGVRLLAPSSTLVRIPPVRGGGCTED